MPTPSILIVACDAFLAGIYGRKFERAGWDVAVSETMEEGEKQAIKMRPSVLLIDVGCVTDLPKEVVRLRNLPVLGETKIVALAQEASREEVSLARSAGIHDYLILGHFVPQEAVEKISSLLES